MWGKEVSATLVREETKKRKQKLIFTCMPVNAGNGGGGCGDQGKGETVVWWFTCPQMGLWLSLLCRLWRWSLCSGECDSSSLKTSSERRKKKGSGERMGKRGFKCPKAMKKVVAHLPHQ